MFSRGRYGAGLAALVGLLILLLAGLAMLQYRWIGEIADAERQRMRGTLELSARRFADDFDREITRAFVSFRPELDDIGNDPQQSALEKFRRWKETAPHPELVSGVLLAQHGSLRRVDLSTGSFQDISWPESLRAIRDTVRSGRRVLGTGGPLLENLPALVLPSEPGGMLGRPPFDAHRAEPPAHMAHIIVLLDSRYIAEGLLPLIARRHIPEGDDPPYALSVWRGNQRVFTSDPRLRERAEITIPVFAVREFPEFGHFGGRGPRPGPGRGQEPPWHRQVGGSADRAPWRVVAGYTSGSLDAAVARTRTRNLAVGGLILALLGTSMALILIAAARTSRTAHQQLEFVASITHELNTPLAAIRSAAENLSDGIVQDPEQTRKYGWTIVEQERRLSAMVADALAFAGIAAGRRGLRREPVDVADVLQSAISEASMAAHGATVVQDEISDHLGLVRGDADALRGALVNLINNALKHGGDSPVTVSAAREGRQLRIRVADSGPGIAEEDLPHIFEPFYRGRGAARRAGGAGLGLSIVKNVIENHGGTIAVNTSPSGTVMTVELPRLHA